MYRIVFIKLNTILFYGRRKSLALIANKNMTMKNKKLYIILFIAVFSILLFFVISNYKKINFGKNIISNQSEKITADILNMNSFTATANIEVRSNKNTNEYLVRQEVKPNFSKQEIISSDDSKEISIINENGKVKIFNMKLNSEKIYEEYDYFINSSLFLTSFIDDFKNSENSKCLEDDNYIILEAHVTNKKNRYTCNKKLYIDKNTKKPCKIEIKDITEKGTIYILYTDIEFSV